MKHHKRYPCIEWVCESIANYRYAVALGTGLCAEYTHRYGKVHAKQGAVEWLRDNEPNLPNTPMTTLTPAVPVECLKQGDTVASYRNYYIYVKRYFAKWTNRDAPKWFSDGVANMSAKDKEWSEKKIQAVKEGGKEKREKIKLAKQKKEQKGKGKEKETENENPQKPDKKKKTPKRRL